MTLLLGATVICAMRDSAIDNRLHGGQDIYDVTLWSSIDYSLSLFNFLRSQAAVPFAVIGSNTVVEVGDQKLRGRLYPWGVVEGINIW